MKKRLHARVSLFLLLFLLTMSFMDVHGQTPAKPFGSNTKYEYGTMQAYQTASQAAQVSESWYTYWASSFIKDCGGGKALVVNDYGGTNAYSEGQGYGMLLAAYHGDKATFDKLVQGYFSNTNSHGLMNWTVSCSNSNVGSNGATDGDLDAAMALLIANKQWPNNSSPNYSTLATTLINNIKTYEFVNCGGKTVQKAGDYLGGCNCTNPSYYATGYYRAFAKHVPGDAAFWTKAADDGLDLLLKATHPTTGLNPAWTDESGSITNGGTGDCNNIQAPGGGSRNDYQFDAARTPWRIVVDYLWWGTPKAKQYLDKITSWASGKGINQIFAGHKLDGTAYLTYTNSAFVGAFAIGAMGTTNQSTVNNFYKYWVDNSMHDQNWASGKTLDDKPYFQNSLRTMYHFVASGNFWNPYSSSTTNPNQAPTVSITAPANNSTHTAPASITIEANASDSDGSVTSVKFYNGNTEIGSDASAPFTYTWNNVAAGTYTITAKATDNSGAETTSSPITIVVNAPVNQAPLVSITSPANNATYTAPASITIEANATDSDGTVSSVKFYNGNTEIGSDASAPFTYTWNDVAAGTYTITAKATDNSGAETTSSPITIVVNAPVNQAPVVSITSPANNATYTAPASITIEANATDSDGTVSNVKFYNGNTEIGSDASAPFAYTWNDVAAGTYTITAKATDNSGAETTSSPITIVVNAPANQAPVVSITSPANNAAFTGPASITIEATASDVDGTVTSVEFYNGSNLLETDNSSPYSFVWTDVAAGTYIITVKATDNSGASTTSDPITVIVNPAANDVPTVAITSPANNATFTAPSTLTIEATAADTDGTITSVDFYNGNDLIGSVDASPYTFTWLNPPAGTHTLTARATDNGGAVATSVPVTIIINAAPNEAPTITITTNGTTFTAPASITIEATATDTDGTITKVDFYNGNDLLETDASSPYSYTWTNVQAGTYQITAKATDNGGAVTTSSVITVVVEQGANQPPAVSITSPVGGTNFTAPATINLEATASDADGTVSKVEFYNGSTKLGEDLSTPFSYVWSNVAAGTYSITAVATDNSGAVTTSSEVTFTVNPVVTNPTGVTIQGESACSVDGLDDDTYYSGYNGPAYINSDDYVGASATWRVNSQTAQSVNLSIRYAHTTDAGRQMALQVNGTEQIASIMFPSTGSGSTWQIVTVQINLSAGENELKLIAGTDAGSPYIDELTFGGAGISEALCPGTSPNGVTIQGEAACAVDGLMDDTYYSGYNGSAYINSDDNVGASATWAINSQSAQTINLSIRYAHTTAAGRQMALEVNGTQQVASILFPSTGSGSNWEYVTTQISLSAGENIVKLIAGTDAGSPYIDELIFGTSTVSAGLCPGTTPVNCAVNAPSASEWIVRNDWSDQHSGSRVSNENNALKVTHRQWGNSRVWAMETGRTFSIESGKTYTIEFQFQNDGSLNANSVDVGFGTVANWNGPTLAGSSVNVSVDGSSSFASKTVTITANANATVFLAFRMNWSSQVNAETNVFIRNVSVCGSGQPSPSPLSASNADFSTGSNPFVDQTPVRINSDNTVPMHLTLTDLSGMTHWESTGFTTNQEVYLGSGLPAGTYIVRAIFDGQVISFRLVKN